MDIYENIVVGNFLFGLGVKMGMEHSAVPVDPVSINLLQQTPLDQRLGDVVVANARIFRLIEFKRDDNKSRKEKAKWRVIADALEAERSVDLVALSRKIHWYVGSDFRNVRPGRRPNIQVASYLDFLRPDDCITLPDFIDKTAGEAVSDVIDEREWWWCNRYVEVVASVLGDFSGASGCLLLVVTGTGQLNYVPVDDIGDLIRTPRMLIERHHARQVELAQAQLAPRQLQGQERALRPRGPSLSR